MKHKNILFAAVLTFNFQLSTALPKPTCQALAMPLVLMARVIMWIVEQMRL